MNTRQLFQRQRLTEGRDDAGGLPLGKAGHAYARITSRDVMDQPGGTSNKWRKNLALQKEVTNQKNVKSFSSMDKVGPVKSAIKDSRSAANVVASMLAE